MKKFLHKKTGLIVIQSKDKNPYYISKEDINKKFNKTVIIDTDIPFWLVENSNDWEEIKEKEWKITSYIGKITDEIFKQDEDSSIWNSTKNSSYIVIPTHKKLVKIYSVKRLSDGEEFKIGDKTNGGTIKQLLYCTSNVSEPCIHIVYEHDLKESEYPNFNNVQKIKSALFTTKDGVSIYNNDDFYIVDGIDFSLKVHKAEENKNIELIVRTNGLITFSTKKKAEEYIINNKPCFSLNDIDKAIGIGPNSRKELIKLIKLKL